MSALFTRFALLVIVFLVILVAGTAGFSALEGLSAIDAFYFTVVTVGTVGYGDIHPATAGGKLLAIAVIVTGVGTFASVMASSVGLLVERRQNEMKRKRMNSLIGLFYSEVGNRLIVEFLSADPGIDHLCKEANIRQDWTDRDFAGLRQRVESHKYAIDYDRIPFDRLKTLLKENTDILLRLYENPNLLEQESFAEMLRATLHLREELVLRRSMPDLPATDVAHLANDAKRVYSLLTKMWLEYMRYLSKAHPYLFSLALRTNPFDESCSPIVT